MTRWTLPHDGTAPVPGRKEDVMTGIDLTPEAVRKLDEKLASQIGDDVSVILNHESLFKQSRAMIAALSAKLAEVEAERDKWFEGAGAHHVASMREAQRADVAEHQRDQATIALMHLERCAQVVSERGAQTGPQWTRLTTAILRARATMSKLPTPMPSSEPPLVQSSTALIPQEKPHDA